MTITLASKGTISAGTSTMTTTGKNDRLDPTSPSPCKTTLHSHGGSRSHDEQSTHPQSLSFTNISPHHISKTRISNKCLHPSALEHFVLKLGRERREGEVVIYRYIIVKVFKVQSAAKTIPGQNETDQITSYVSVTAPRPLSLYV